MQKNVVLAALLGLVLLLASAGSVFAQEETWEATITYGTMLIPVTIQGQCDIALESTADDTPMSFSADGQFTYFSGDDIDDVLNDNVGDAALRVSGGTIDGVFEASFDSADENTTLRAVFGNSQGSTKWEATITYGTMLIPVTIQGQCDIALESTADDTPMSFSADGQFTYFSGDDIDDVLNDNVGDAALRVSGGTIDGVFEASFDSADENTTLRAVFASGSGSSLSGDPHTCLDEGTYFVASNGLNLRNDDMEVIAFIPFNTQVIITEQGCGRVSVSALGQTGTVITTGLSTNPQTSNGNNGNGSNFTCTTPFEWPAAYPIELGTDGSSNWGNNDFAIIQWYRPGGTGDGAFLARNSIDLPNDVSGSAWVLPNASQAQAQCLLSQDAVALQYGIEAP